MLFQISDHISVIRICSTFLEKWVNSDLESDKQLAINGTQIVTKTSEKSFTDE